MLRTIHFHIIDDIAHLILASPPKNEMGEMFFIEFSKIVNSLDSFKNLKGIIINSEGRHFSSGANISQLMSCFSESSEDIPDQMVNNLNNILKISKLNIPVVAIIKGICIGSGFELGLSAHFRIAAKNAVMALPELSFDLIPGLGGIVNLTNIVGKSKAMEYILTAETIDAEQALKLGIVDELSEKSQLIEKAEKLIRFINTFSEYSPVYRNYYLHKYQKINAPQCS